MTSQRWVPQTEHEHAVMRVLTSIRALSDAMDRMHSGMKGDMEMNSTDLAALRLLIMREQRGQAVGPRDIAEHLRISTASTTKLLDRLAASGHVERLAHPSDRRARVVVLTEESRLAFFRIFGERLRAMRGVAVGYDQGELAVIERFLNDLSGVIDPSD
ncbi:MarR family winged helix-turn-helix transcriptional regulator [Microbacterium allomyrinae]|jgi:DNA-binding MarR family transcriptional regulator|uniref:MarR family transcriptional regulator n=1 Tax=Microbacterium allomyrinae TaxID=2830666 RepID=A0A9X1LZR9_9MICO|nr:MarR family transcriptional regulator [Microbacterium allomyrinae]MCC2034175.1 MarR family transcriptional regulator [Microbacterium allomyrinae]